MTDFFGNQAEGQNANTQGPIQQVKVGMEASTIAIVISLLLVIAANAVVMGFYISQASRAAEDYKTMKTQTWLLERRLMDREALDIVNGAKLPSDDEHGATGNLQRMKPKEK